MLKKDIAFMIEGFKKINEFTEAERVASLPNLTVEETRRRYIDLCEVWERSGKIQGALGLLDQLKIEEVVERRRLLGRIAATKRKNE